MDIAILGPLKNALLLCLKLTLIIVTLMIIYEFYENSKLYKLSQSVLNKPFGFIGIKSNASITMIVGLVLGIAYGAGILIKNAISGNMTQKEIILTSIFLSVCHAVFEDTLLFVAVGANGIVIIGVRIILAFIIILLLNKYLSKSKTI